MFGSYHVQLIIERKINYIDVSISVANAKKKG
jgi:hypothetical protein